MDPHEEFNRNMQKLMVLLGKILKSQKEQVGMDFSEIFNSKKNVNLNLCIFTFLPMTPEDMDDLEEVFEDMYVSGEGITASSSGEPELKFELNARDVDFLKNNGIRF